MKKLLLLFVTTTLLASLSFAQSAQETIKAIPWIADTTLPDAVSAKSVAPLMKKHLLMFQAMQLKNGIKPSLGADYTNPNNGNVIASNVVTTQVYDKTGTARTIQRILFFEAHIAKGAVIPDNDIMAGKLGAKLEELTLDGNQWTLTNKNGVFTGKVK